MGGGASTLTPEEKEAQLRSKEVDQINQQDFRAEQSKVKLLLLGAGESGKSTIFKQMKVLYGAPLSEAERREVTPLVYENTLAAMKTLLEQTHHAGFEVTIQAADAVKTVTTAMDGVDIDIALGQALKDLWSDPGIMQTWERRNEFQVMESAKYFFQEVDRIMQPDYLATQQDMLYVRIRSSGIATERYMIDNSIFEMYDVGGQRTERKKWIHCFDNVTAVIFVAALSEYDQALFEDPEVNRMVEAIELFSEICNNRFFERSSMILFLNKRDLFAEKILIKDIKSVNHFSDFTGGLGDFDSGVAYFLNLFLKVNRNPDRAIYHHVTCATDTHNVQVVFNACKDIIIRNNLEESGFMG